MWCFRKNTLLQCTKEGEELGGASKISSLADGEDQDFII